MEIRRQTRETFLPHAAPFLLREEAMNNLLLGLGHTLVANPDAYPLPAYLATVEQDGRVVLVALRTPPFGLALSTVDPRCDRDATAAALAADVSTVFPALPGVAGPRAVVRTFLRHWEPLTGQRAALVRAERIYELAEVVAPPPVSGSMRRADVRDRDLLEAFVAAFQAESGGNAPDGAPAVVRRRLSTVGSAFYLWEDPEPVCLVGCSGLTPTGIRIGPVYTPPAFRRRGYAATLVARVSQSLLDGGRARCFLYTDLANPTSNALYQRIGYRSVGDVDEFGLLPV